MPWQEAHRCVNDGCIPLKGGASVRHAASPWQGLLEEVIQLGHHWLSVVRFLLRPLYPAQLYDIIKHHQSEMLYFIHSYTTEICSGICVPVIEQPFSNGLSAQHGTSSVYLQCCSQGSVWGQGRQPQTEMFHTWERICGFNSGWLTCLAFFFLFNSETSISVAKGSSGLLCNQVLWKLAQQGFEESVLCTVTEYKIRQNYILFFWEWLKAKFW